MKQLKIWSSCCAAFIIVSAPLFYKFERLPVEKMSSNSISNQSLEQMSSFNSISNQSLVFNKVDFPTTSPSDEVTIVTSFIDIGTITKGSSPRQSSVFYHWMQIFSKIKNPVIGYFTDEKIENQFRQIRAMQPKNRTRTVIFSRNTSWAFYLKPRIKKILSSPGYPKFHPNTVVPEYGCIMHAKYEMVSAVARKNPFKTKYIAWLDIGYFRDLVGKNISEFYLGKPPGFLDDKVAYGQIYSMEKCTSNAIFKKNMVFIGGGYFIAQANVLLSWAEVYRYHVMYYLNKGLSSTDQQVLYSMAVDNSTAFSRVQLYSKHGQEKYSVWFYLGFISKKDQRTQHIH